MRLADMGLLHAPTKKARLSVVAWVVLDAYSDAMLECVEPLILPSKELHVGWPVNSRCGTLTKMTPR